MVAQRIRDRWRDEYEAGHSTGQIAARWGWTRETVRRALRAMGTEMRPTGNRATPDTLGQDRTLDRGIARLEAQIADDMTRGGSAFTT